MKTKVLIFVDDSPLQDCSYRSLVETIERFYEFSSQMERLGCGWKLMGEAFFGAVLLKPWAFAFEKIHAHKGSNWLLAASI
jgi:hypothetical protein